MTDSPAAPREKRAAPWRGRKRVADPRNAWVHVRCTAAEYAAINAAAERAGLETSSYMRAMALGGGPKLRARRRPSVELVELSRTRPEVTNWPAGTHKRTKLERPGPTSLADRQLCRSGRLAVLRSG